MVNGNSDNVPETRPDDQFADNQDEAADQTNSGSEFDYVQTKTPSNGLSIFSISQKIIITLIVIISLTLAFLLFKHPKTSITDPNSTTYSQNHTATPQPPKQQPLSNFKSQISNPAPAETELTAKDESAAPLSLQTAQILENQKNYQQAYDSYNRLSQILPQTDTQSRLLADFLHFKRAICLERLGKDDDADRIFKNLAGSSSPAIRCFAAYDSIARQIKSKQYIAALTTSYRCLGLLELVKIEKDSAAALTRNCYFLAAQTLTQNILLLSGQDKGLPEQLWMNRMMIDPFIGLNEEQVLSLASGGCDTLNKALLSCQIQKIQQLQNMPDRWLVISNKTPVEELLSRFASGAGLELKWNFSSEGSSEQTNIRKRMVTLYLPAATAQQIVIEAAGCAGLIASIDDKGIITLSNPADFSTLSEQLSVCSEQAVNLWHQFLFRFDQDSAAGNVHFALGLLFAQANDTPKAVTEFKLVSNRFTHSPLVPFALLYSSRLKTNIKDYRGAREDLMQLVEQYPDASVADQAVSYLADAAMKESLYSEARPLYEKLYNLNLSPQSQASACFGIGCCFFDEKEYEPSIKWLTRFINLTKDNPDENFYKAYLLIGRAYIGLDKPDQACAAFQYALEGRHSPEEYVQIISALVDGFIAREKLVEAIGILDTVEAWRLSQNETVKVLLLKAKVLRLMGFVDKAVAAVGDRADFVTDEQLKAEILFELAQCYKADDRLELARRNLSDVLTLAEKGPLFYDAALQLAAVCKKMEKNSEAISVCIQILNSQPKTDVKKQALSILADAYRSRKDYDNALLALMGNWKNDKQ
jgi:tetratricopeptide (TPR) repeat protein